MTHQELLDGYVRASLSVIGDRSGNFDRDARELHAKVKAYAEEHGLTVNDDDFELYLDGEQW